MMGGSPGVNRTSSNIHAPVRRMSTVGATVSQDPGAASSCLNDNQKLMVKFLDHIKQFGIRSNQIFSEPGVDTEQNKLDGFKSKPKKGLSENLSNYNINSVATAFKHHLQNAEPLFTYSLYDEVLSIRDDSKAYALKNIISRLPEANQYCLSKLCHVLTLVWSNQSSTNMDSRALGHIFAPHLLQRQSSNGDIQAVMREMKAVEEIVVALLEEAAAIFGGGSGGGMSAPPGNARGPAPSSSPPSFGGPPPAFGGPPSFGGPGRMGRSAPPKASSYDEEPEDSYSAPPPARRMPPMASRGAPPSFGPPSSFGGPSSYGGGGGGGVPDAPDAPPMAPPMAPSGPPSAPSGPIGGPSKSGGGGKFGASAPKPSGGGGGRGDLLSQIQKGKKLAHTETVDKSGPYLDDMKSGDRKSVV